MTYQQDDRPVPPVGMNPQQQGQSAPQSQGAWQQIPPQQQGTWQQSPWPPATQQQTPWQSYPQMPYQQSPNDPFATDYPQQFIRPPIRGGVRWLFAAILPMCVYLGLQIVCVLVGDVILMYMGARAAEISQDEFLTWCITASQLLAILVGIPWYRHLRRTEAKRPVSYKGAPPIFIDRRGAGPITYLKVPPTNGGAATFVPTWRDEVIHEPQAQRSKRSGRAGKTLLSVLLILVIGVLAQIATDALLTLVSPLIPDTMAEYNELMKQMTDTSAVSVVSLAILAPVAEEIYFRGITLETARRISPKVWVAVLVQAALFGLAHGNPIQSTYTFLLGLLMGVVALRAGGLPATILLHFAVNSSSYAADQLLGWAAAYGTAGYALAAGASIAIGAICLFALMRVNREGSPA